jgi:YegS/Rv2252/BmrU family lipid kinase
MYYFIINLGARSGRSIESWKRIKYELESYNIEFRAIYTKYAGHASELAAQLTSDDTKKTVIVIGGDGTLNEVISGMQRYDTITLGYIPNGSSNDFGRSIKATADPVKAIQKIIEPEEIRQLDIGLLKRADTTRKFLVSCGFGFDGAICHEVAVSPIKKILNFLHLGRLVYIVIGIKQLFTLRTTSITISLDSGTERTYDKTLLAAIHNVPYEGGGIQFCPHALPDDQEMDVCIVQCSNPFYGLLLIPFAMFGMHRHFPGVHLLRGKEISIKAERALPVHVDGEPVGEDTALHISCLANELQVITK